MVKNAFSWGVSGGGLIRHSGQSDGCDGTKVNDAGMAGSVVSLASSKGGTREELSSLSRESHE